ncbi:MAG TPA: hypothetical protein PLV68_21500 [Ilumatobacteraceae bacterium]|nr:hypothetical protein [Ilumatobacteraceae bacterium]
MAIVIAFIVLALIFGVGGLVKGLFWLASIGLILLLVAIALAISTTRRSGSS